MPELPEVEVVRTALDSQLSGLCLRQVNVRYPRLRYPLPDFSDLLDHRLLTVKRRAKYLLLHFDHQKSLVWHLGMSGHFHILQPEQDAGKHEHVQLLFDTNHSLRYRDPRRFGYADILPTQTLHAHPWFSKLGPEPLSVDFTVEAFNKALANRSSAIKSCIMNAAIVVGVGNIYASESLYMAGIHPAKAARSISLHQIERLHQSIQQVLTAAIKAGGSTIQSFSHPDGKPGYFAHEFRVYGREGKPCKHCHTSICKITQQGRSTFYCANCQQ